MRILIETITPLSIYGEWCGGSIRVGVSNLPKSSISLVLNQPNVENETQNQPAYWLDHSHSTH
jgi:hypothetical protein